MLAMSETETPSAAARWRSMTTLTCGLSKASESWTTMNLPDFIALPRDRLGLLDRRGSAASVDWMTKEMGRPPPVPGSEGMAKTKACTPATLPSRPWMSCCTCAWLRLRCAHGFSTQAAKAELAGPPMPATEKRVVTSGMSLVRLSISSRKRLV